MKTIQNLFLLLFYSLIISSCSVYYNTSEINSNLSQFVKQVKNNYNTVEFGLKKLDFSYSQLNSIDEKDPFKTARTKLNALNQQLSSIAISKNEIEAEYEKYKHYSKGKNKISSNSEEWALLKETKKKMKFLNEKVKTQAETFNKQAEEFQLFFKTKINPLVKRFKTTDYKNQFISLIEKSKKLKEDNLIAILQYKVILEEIEEKKISSQTKNIAQLSSLLAEIAMKIKFIEKSETTIVALMKRFSNTTSTVSEFYNTDPIYKEISQIENELNTCTNAIELNQKQIENNYLSFQNIAKQLEQK